MVYKYHKAPHELECNKTRLRKPTEEERKIIQERTRIVREKLKQAFPDIDIEAQTFDPEN